MSRKNGAAQAIRAILVLQIGIAAVVFARDIAGALPRLSLAPAPPQLTEPVRPGDQTRRYQPRRQRTGPGVPDAAPDMPARLAMREDGGAIVLRGEIAPGDAQRFTDWLAGRAGAAEVRIDSPGGSVVDALAIGRAIRAAGLDSAMAAGDACLSACPYVLAGGVARRIDRQAVVGVHQHYFGESTVLPAFIAIEDIQRGQAEVLDHLVAMGIDPRLMRHSLATPPDEIYILLPEQLTDYALATEITG